MTLAEYRSRHAGAPTISETRRRALRRQANRQFSDPLKRIEIGAERHSRIRDWLIVEGIAQGKPHQLIAKSVGRSQSVISDRARQLGFSNANCRYYFGQPFDSQAVQCVKKRTGLFARVLAAESGVSIFAMQEAQWPKRQHQRAKPHTAEKLTAWLDETVEKLMAIDFRKRLHVPSIWHRCSRHSLLFTLVPRLRENYDLLLSALHRLRIFLRADLSAGPDRVQDYLCEQAGLEVAKVSRENVFAPFLPWAPELMPFLKRDLERLRGQERLERISREWLAARCHTKPSVMDSALRRSRTRMVAPNDVAMLIQSLNIRSEPMASKARVPRGRPADRKEIFIEARRLHEQENLSWRKCAQRLIPHDEFVRDPKHAAENLRKGVIHLRKLQTASADPAIHPPLAQTSQK